MAESIRPEAEQSIMSQLYTMAQLDGMVYSFTPIQTRTSLL
jgi:hypothetical protein